MGKRALAALALALALLAGCTPAADPPAPLPTAESPSPSPQPTASPAPEPAHGDRLEFYAFLEEASAAREAIQNRAEPIDLSAYTPDFYDQNHTFTQEELDLLFTYRGAAEGLTREDLLADADTFFTLLQTTYGAYHYFGGDETFLPIRDAVKAELAAAEAPTVKTLEDVLYRDLSPVLTDGHFLLGDHAMRDAHTQYMYYVPELYLDSPEGAENPDYLKPTIGPNGRICWWYAALSRDSRDLPSALDGRALTWRRAGVSSQNDRDPAFSEEEWQGVPILTSRRMRDGGVLPTDQETLARFSSCGEEYANSPLLIFDLRGNGGGSDKYIMNWFRGWTGAEARPRTAFSHRYSQISCRAFDGSYPAERMGTYSHNSSLGTWAERSGPVFVLQDKTVASSGETAVRFFRTAADTLTVGGPTMGCSLTPNNLALYLPRSSLGCYFGTGLSLMETGENIDGAGFLPDLWVEPATALDAVKCLIEYYGLNAEA